MSEADSNTTPTLSTVQDVVGDGGDAALAPVVAAAPSADPTPSPAVVVPVHEAADAAIVLEPHVLLAPATRVRYYTAPQCTVLSPLTTIFLCSETVPQSWYDAVHGAFITMRAGAFHAVMPPSSAPQQQQQAASSSTAAAAPEHTLLSATQHTTGTVLCCRISLDARFLAVQVSETEVSCNKHVAVPTHQSATHSSRSPKPDCYL